MSAQRFVQELGPPEVRGHGGQAPVEMHRGHHHVGRAVDHVAPLAREPFRGTIDERAAAGQHGAAQAADALAGAVAGEDGVAAADQFGV